MRLVIHNLALDCLRQAIEPLMGIPTEHDRKVELDNEVVRQALINAVSKMTEDQMQALVSMALEFGRPS